MIVLIVGRDASQSEGVESALSDLGVDWKIKFVADASAALSYAQANPIEVVVAEMRPIGMEGTALLDRVKSHHPEAARIMLLDETEESQAMRALSSAHRLLNKPLRAEELLEAVEGISELHEILNSPELKAAVGKLDKLPPPPKLYLALTRALDDPNVSPASLATLIQQDPAMAAKVLRLCNSAYFSGGRTITDIRTAVIRLGQQILRRMVLATEVFADSTNSKVDRDAMRRRALLSSQLASKLLAGSSSELAGTAALLAEVGMLLPGVKILNKDGELEGEGPHYAEAGAYILGMWGLPMPIVEAVANHQQPGRSNARGFWVPGAVHVARALIAQQPLDENYLSQVGMADKLPAWQKLAEDLLGAEE
ncbi:HDOD domain-containing protein [Pseudomarimonas arenosa]|uniref:HDOD domain-containing protein n=1 Tax=Pseudomarimonas arenosa TaxID=2774145 RepID=UPI002FC2A836